VRVRGRITPSLAGELEAVSAHWLESIASTNGAGDTDRARPRSRTRTQA
jgi:hypothetical protein